MYTPPEAVARTSTRSPGLMPAASRTCFGSVTCPLDVTVVVMAALGITFSIIVILLLRPVNEILSHACPEWRGVSHCIPRTKRGSILAIAHYAVVSRPHRHPHPRLRGRQPRRMVRGQFPGLRARQDAAAGDGFDHPGA